jgi:hypothetical protein
MQLLPETADEPRFAEVVGPAAVVALGLREPRLQSHKPAHGAPGRSVASGFPVALGLGGFPIGIALLRHDELQSEHHDDCKDAEDGGPAGVAGKSYSCPVPPRALRYRQLFPEQGVAPLRREHCLFERFLYVARFGKAGGRCGLRRPGESALDPLPGERTAGNSLYTRHLLALVGETGSSTLPTRQ